MEFLKKIISPVALKSEPAQPEAQPEPGTPLAQQQRKPPLQVSSRPQQQTETRVRTELQANTTPQFQQDAAEPRVHEGTATRVAQATPPPDQPQAPVWAQVPTQKPPQPVARQRASAQPIRITPPVPPALRDDKYEKAGPDFIASAGIPLGTAGPTSYLSNVPGFWRKVWAMHPNRTKRRLRQLLLSWEKLGACISSPGAAQDLTPAAETAFLKAKIDIARSVGYLKMLEATGGIAKEADQKEAQFVELLERFPSLHSARSAGEAARRNLYYNWHLLYLFLHKMLGADPYEPSGRARALGGRMETVIASRKVTPGGGRRTG